MIAFANKWKASIALFTLCLIGVYFLPNRLIHETPKEYVKTQMRLAIIKESLYLMRLDTSQFPSTRNGLDCLVKNLCGLTGWDGPYLTERSIKDGWLQPFVYVNESTNESFILYSVGPNGIDEHGEQDDIWCAEICVKRLSDVLWTPLGLR